MPLCVDTPKIFSKGESVIISVLINVMSSKTGYKLLSIDEKSPEKSSFIVSKIISVILRFSVFKLPHPNYIRLFMAAKIKSVARIKA